MYLTNDNQEWNWLFEHTVNWDKLLSLYYPNYPTSEGFESKEDVLGFYKEMLQGTRDWANQSVKEIGFELDQKGAGEVRDGRTFQSDALKRLIKEASELQVFGLPIEKKYGGLETPTILYLMMLNQTAKHCMSSSTLLAFYTSIADMVALFCTEEQAHEFIPKIIDGKLSGSMNLTEPSCGSDLSMMKTSATPQEDGTYLLNGEKIFITNGGGGLAFVLAKVKGASDTLDGISMFFVEQFPNAQVEPNFRVEKTEEKMGMHGSFTTVVTYENTKAQLVGKEGEGFKYMLHLMNEARICVGVQALGGIEGCLEYAQNYADERVAFGKPISQLPLMTRLLDDCRVERDAIRAFCVDTMSWFDIYTKLDKKKKLTSDLNESELKLFKKAHQITRKRTPLIKFYATEAFVEISKKCVQVYGGYGFIKEYPVERIHRDSFGPLLYEGTSQVQALMALKDTMKNVMKNPKGLISSLVTNFSSSIISSDSEEMKEYKKTLFKFEKSFLGLIFKTLKPKEVNKIHKMSSWVSEEAIDKMMVHAETLTWALSYLETLQVLVSHIELNSSRSKLYTHYHRLIIPKLEGIYKDWELRS